MFVGRWRKSAGIFIFRSDSSGIQRYIAFFSPFEASPIVTTNKNPYTFALFDDCFDNLIPPPSPKAQIAEFLFFDAYE